VKGDRVAALAPPEAIRVWIGLYLLSPQIPMLLSPYPFFSSARDDMRRTVECDGLEELKATYEHDDRSRGCARSDR